MAPPTAIPDTMTAAQVVEYGQPYRLNTVPVPKNLEPHDLLVKIAVASFCHTDIMVAAGHFKGTKMPLTGSHEGAGTVVAVGSAVASSREFSVGDRVMCGTPRNSCGTCADCTTGLESQRQYCAAVEGHCGVLSVDGFFAEYARVDARWTTLLPDNVSLLAAAPLACAGRTVWRGLQQAIQKASLTSQSWLCIVGSGGGLGHIAVQFAVQSGLRVIGIDAREEGLAATREAGAEVVLDARDGKEANVAAVRKTTGLQNGADATLLVADVTSAAALACAVTRTHGTVVELAQPDNFTIPFAELIMRDIRLVGSCFCSPQESRDMVAFVTEHGLRLHTVPFQGLDKIHELVALVHSGTIKGKAAIIVDDGQVTRDATSGAMKA